MRIETPPDASPGERIPIRVVLTSNKVGHDFPTGPLDLIQSWVEISVIDEAGSVIFASGRRDPKHFIEPGTFLFKAEPVDQYGNLIDRHNLWEMVGVRYRRSLFPGYSDTVEYQAACPSTVSRPARAVAGGEFTETHDFAFSSRPAANSYRVTATLQYRKIDQFLLNYLLGEKAGITAPVVGLSSATATVNIHPKRAARRNAKGTATIARFVER